MSDNPPQRVQKRKADGTVASGGTDGSCLHTLYIGSVCDEFIQKLARVTCESTCEPLPLSLGHPAKKLVRKCQTAAAAALELQVNQLVESFEFIKGEVKQGKYNPELGEWTYFIPSTKGCTAIRIKVSLPSSDLWPAFNVRTQPIGKFIAFYVSGWKFTVDGVVVFVSIQPELTAPHIAKACGLSPEYVTVHDCFATINGFHHDREWNKYDKIGVMRKLIRALVWMYAMLKKEGWVHGDLKPENIMVVFVCNEIELVLVDCESMCRVHSRLDNQFVCCSLPVITPAYTLPRLQGTETPITGRCLQMNDLVSLLMIIFVTIFGFFPNPGGYNKTAFWSKEEFKQNAPDEASWDLVFPVLRDIGVNVSYLIPLLGELLSIEAEQPNENASKGILELINHCLSEVIHDRFS